jgi:hypothetical protein
MGACPRTESPNDEESTYKMTDYDHDHTQWSLKPSICCISSSCDPMYPEYSNEEALAIGKESTQSDLCQNNSWTLTPIPKQTFASFEMRNRSETVVLDDLVKISSAESSPDYNSNEYSVRINPGPDMAQKLAAQLKLSDVSQAMPTESILSYDEYDMRNCCAFNTTNGALLKKRLFGTANE